jgi:c-di-GMP-binding flagellar brake protein YcgR
MSIPEEKTRLSERFPYTYPVSFITLGDINYPPNDVATEAETMDISNGGMKIRVKGRSLKQGAMIQVRIPVSELKVTVPVLTEVRWVRDDMPKNYQIGLRFLV